MLYGHFCLSCPCPYLCLFFMLSLSLLSSMLSSLPFMFCVRVFFYERQILITYVLLYMSFYIEKHCLLWCHNNFSKCKLMLISGDSAIFVLYYYNYNEALLSPIKLYIYSIYAKQKTSISTIKWSETHLFIDDALRSLNIFTTYWVKKITCQ